jgi:hypothetical protein
MSAQDLTKVTVSGVIDNISAAGQIYLPVPEMFDGTILQILATLDAAISVANATLTVKNSDGTTIGTLVVPFSGSAAGKTSTINLSGLCRPNEAIEIETNGGSTTAVKCYVTVVIKR